MKETLTILVGPSGSGKTTWARSHSNTDTVHLSSDEIRGELFGHQDWQYSNSYLRKLGYSYDEVGEMTPKDKKKICTKKVFEIMMDRTEDVLWAGRNVIYDATDLTVANRRLLIDKFKSVPGVEIECVVFETNKETCKRRNQEREYPVPDFIIDNQFNLFEYPTPDEGFTRILTA